MTIDVWLEQINDYFVLQENIVHQGKTPTHTSFLNTII